MIREWRRLTSGSRDDEFEDQLVDFLVSSGDARAVAALEDGLRRQTIDRRLAVIEKFAHGELPPQSFSPTSNTMLMPVMRPATAAYSKAVERLLAGELTDTARRVGSSMSLGTLSGREASFEDPHIWEVAAFALSVDWPKKYHYQPVPSPGARERMRIQCLNTWRSAQGLSARPVPVQHTHKLPSDPVQARRFSCTVRLVVVKGAVAARYPMIVREARRLEGRALTTSLLLHLLYTAVAELEAHDISLELIADRDQDGRGFAVSLEFRRPETSPSDGGWSSGERVSAGTESLLFSSGSSTEDYMRSADAFKSFGAAVSKALASEPRTALHLSETLTHHTSVSHIAPR
jgi:hypothetical protein